MATTVERLSGKVAVVTGGAGGLGSATCRRLVEEGAQVVVADVNAAAATALADELGKAAVAFEFDYRDEASVKSLIETTVQQFGRLDLLHNNAVGGDLSRDGLVEDAEAAVWDTQYEITIRGYLFGCKYAIRHMKTSGGGVIINMGSDSALAGDLMLTAYGATKAAVITMSQYVATQYGKHGIRCVSITPGAMLTDSMRQNMGVEGVRVLERHHLTPSLGDPGNVAALVAHLASDDSAFITGINIPVDGGFYSHLPTTADFRRS
jgi:NAD(P)-dependent dehydrogenase (short-subunit alcohol dehydrogenase family)